jgi:hypothetical protein
MGIEIAAPFFKNVVRSGETLQVSHLNLGTFYGGYFEHPSL